MILTYIFIAINVVFIFFLVFPFFANLLASLSRKKKVEDKGEPHDFACVITAYRNLAINRPLVESLLKQNYTNYHVYLVADRCEIKDWDLRHEKFTLLAPPEPLNSKVNSLRYALAHFHRPHQGVVVWDPDNLAHPNVLKLFDQYFHAGYQAVQGKRTAKNLDTVYACIDGMCELYYNYAMRYNLFRMGSSSTIAGSGMAVQTALFKDCLQLQRMDTREGESFIDEDKVLQMGIVERGKRIAFTPEAIIYDEKVDSADQVEKQRSRWLSSYFQQVPQALGMIFKGLFTFNWNKLWFGVSTLYPPLFILAISSALLLFIDALFFFPELFVPLLVAGLIFTLNFFLILKKARAPKEIWQAIWGIPVFVSSQIRALLKIKREKGNEAPTENKRVVSIDELLSKE
ncbi:MAG: cell wall biosynthesis glycosyltransferase [Bacteroidetes bacterium]|nr:MAG: cell wall biosynthesis glycosyltransferase [Bacteroidota bacterium]